MGTNNPAAREIPVIDIAPLVRGDEPLDEHHETIRAMRDAGRDIGFFYVRDHGIPDHHLDTVFTRAREFFARSLDEKMGIHIARSEIFRGYIPPDHELTNGRPDRLEAVDFGYEPSPDDLGSMARERLQGPNQWPGNLPGFKTAMLEHWDRMQALGKTITEGLALSLGLDRDYFHPFTRTSQSTMRILHYPPTDEHDSHDDVRDGLGEHIDYDFITILAQDGVAGLEVKDSAGEWMPAPNRPGTFLINLGHTMQRWTNDVYKAAVHRVRLVSHDDRYSLPFFFAPDFDTVITPLTCCCGADNPPRHEPLHYGRYVIGKFTSSYHETIGQDQRAK